MLVLHPNISTATAWIAANVSVAAGWAAVDETVADGISDAMAVERFDVAAGVTVELNVGGGMINGVGVTMGGVPVGTGESAGKGWGATPQTSHAPRKNASRMQVVIRFMKRLYLSLPVELRSHREICMVGAQGQPNS